MMTGSFSTGFATEASKDRGTAVTWRFIDLGGARCPFPQTIQDDGDRGVIAPVGRIVAPVGCPGRYQPQPVAAVNTTSAIIGSGRRARPDVAHAPATVRPLSPHRRAAASGAERAAAHAARPAVRRSCRVDPGSFTPSPSQ